MDLWKIIINFVKIICIVFDGAQLNKPKRFFLQNDLLLFHTSMKNVFFFYYINIFTQKDANVFFF